MRLEVWAIAVRRKDGRIGRAVIAATRDKAKAIAGRGVAGPKRVTTEDEVEVARRRPGVAFVTWDEGEIWEAFT